MPSRGASSAHFDGTYDHLKAQMEAIATFARINIEEVANAKASTHTNVVYT